MPTEKFLSSLVINKVDNVETLDSMVEAGLVNEDELYLIEEGVFEGGGGESNVFIAEYGVTTCAEIEEAFRAGKVIVAKTTGRRPQFYTNAWRMGANSWTFGIIATAFIEEDSVFNYWYHLSIRCINDVWYDNSYTLPVRIGALDSYTMIKECEIDSTDADGNFYTLSPSDDGIACNINGEEGHLATKADIGTGVFVAKYRKTTCAELEAAYQAGKIIIVHSPEFKYYQYGLLVVRTSATSWCFTCASAGGRSIVIINCVDDEWTNTSNGFALYQHASDHAVSGFDPITPESIGALSTSGGNVSGNLTVAADSTPTVAKVRNSSLNSTETTPTANGTIAWTYE